MLKIDQHDLSQFPTEDLLAIQKDLVLILRSRKQEALKAFREANPLLGMTLSDGEGTFLGFWDTTQQPPPWVFRNMSKHDRAMEIDKVFNTQLAELLKGAQQERASVIFDPTKNTASGEEWTCPEMDLAV